MGMEGPNITNSAQTESNAAKKKQELIKGIVDSIDELLTKSQENYETHKGEILSSLDKIFQASPETLRFGPDYCIATKAGKQLRVHTLFFDHKKADSSDRYYFFMAENEEGRLVGHRGTIISLPEHPGFKPFAMGLIMVGEKKAGIAIPLEIVNVDIIKKEANRCRQRIEWHITFANKGDSEEQSRWEAIYGYGTKGVLTEDPRIVSSGLGFDKTIIPERKPIAESAELEQIETITLQRQVGVLAVETGRTLATSKEVLRERKIKEFKELLGK